MPVLKKGSSGPAVAQLQTKLKALGFYLQGNVDQIFGPQTAQAVEQFQRSVDRLKVDGIYGPNSHNALEQALLTHPETPAQSTTPPVTTIDDATWSGFVDLVDLLVSTPCRYVPGRGAFDADNGMWLVRNRSGNHPRGKPMGAHGFVYSTFTNFLCAYLLRRDEAFTGTGGMPSLALVMESSSELHQVPGLPGATYRGYGDQAFKLYPTIRDVRASTLLEDLPTLPTFIICEQASKRNGRWMYHHTCAFIHSPEGTLHRIAADGYRGRQGFSKTPMLYKTVTAEDCATWDAKYRFRCYGLEISAETAAKPMRPVRLE